MKVEILNNKIKIIDTIKLLIYKENPDLFGNLDFDDDNVFLEPLLFAYFNSKESILFSNEILEEILQGYLLEQSEIKINRSYNKENIFYLPNLGYYNWNEIQVEKLLWIDIFEIVKEIHPIINPYFIESKDGHITNKSPEFTSVWSENYDELCNSIELIKTHLPLFYQKLAFSNRKIYLHNNYKILNFTSIETLGMLYFYVLGSNNLIYFIEELIHQGSHNFLYYVVYNKSNYFKIDVENLIMWNFTGSSYDNRTIYDAFHGLYTVTQRMKNFDLLLSNNVFLGSHKHELLGRLADQFTRFKTGLELLNIEEVYTDLGKSLYFQWIEEGEIIENKYFKLKNYLNLSNLDIDFRYDDFCKLNPIEDFYKNEQLFKF